MEQRHLNTYSERNIGSPAGTASDRYSALALVERSSINWRAIFAGAFIAFLVFATLISLGVAIGGSSAPGVGAGIWLVVSAFIGLFVGSYFAGRVAGMISTRVGATQGFVIASLFFGFLLMLAGAMLGTVGAGGFGARTAQATSMAGWTLFTMMALGTFFSLLGGSAGAISNLRAPLSRTDEQNFERSRAA